MTWTNPTTRSTGDLITAGNWNTDLVDNLIELHEAPACRVYNSGAITLSDATDTYLTFNSERYDNDGIHSTSVNTGRLTCVTPGVYNIFGNVQFNGNATGQRRLWFRLNGTTIIAFYNRDPSTNQDMQVFLATQYKLAASDYVELGVFQNRGGTLDIEVGANYSPEFGMSFASAG